MRGKDKGKLKLGEKEPGKQSWTKMDIVKRRWEILKVDSSSNVFKLMVCE